MKLPTKFDKAKQKEYRERYKAKARAAGLCWMCQKRPQRPGRKNCDECAQRRSDDLKRLSRERASSGRCAKCAKRPPREGLLTCQKCYERDAQTERTRARWATRTASGLCGTCGKVPPEPDRGSCQKCRERLNAAALRSTTSRRAVARREGRCGYCLTAEPAEGKRYCQPCRDKVRVAKYGAFGLTMEKYKAMGSACHICGDEVELHVDHHHGGGFVRGLLCQLCNNGLGMFRDRPEIVDRAAEYLRRTAEEVAAPLRLVKDNAG